MTGCVSMKQRKIYHYNPKLKKRARQLRNKNTLMPLTSILSPPGRGNNQNPPLPQGEGQGEGKIEIDGDSHDSNNVYQKDAERQRKMEGLGIQFLRFNDLDVKRNMPGVLSVIEQWIEGHTPDPSQEGN